MGTHVRIKDEVCGLSFNVLQPGSEPGHMSDFWRLSEGYTRDHSTFPLYMSESEKFL